MNITLAGTSSGMAVASRAPSALFIGINQDGFLIDAGDGTARQLVRLGLDHTRIRAVILSHMHADHAAGLIGILQLMHLSGRQNPVRVFVPDAVKDRMNDLLPLYQIFLEKWPFDIEFCGLRNRTEESISTLIFKPVLNSHLAKNELFARDKEVGTESYSIIFGEEDHPLCLYTSDINDFAHLENEVRNVDLLVSECTHVDVEQCIRFAKEHDIPRVLFTHIPPNVDANLKSIKRRFTDPSIRFASDGETVEIA
jgi:ribonuclease BN (tRNA processing enzyme)